MSAESASAKSQSELMVDSHLARKIVQQLGSSGQPPEVGVQYFTVGIEPYISVIDEEYLDTFVPDGGSAFKLVEGVYGGGKTHFLYVVRNHAWAHNFAVSYVSLKSGGECPFDKLELVYKAILGGLLPPITDPDISVDDTKGIENFLRYWYSKRYRDHQAAGMSAEAARAEVRKDISELAYESVRSISFRNAIVRALEATAIGEDTLYSEICQWLKGEVAPTAKLKKLSITQKIDRTTAFEMIRSLAQMMRRMGYSGLIVLLDEAELIPSMGRGQREQLLSNLREFIDECGNNTFQGMMVFYAVPDRSFLESRTQVYEALRQRLSTEFELFNPTGVTIILDDAIDEPMEFLHEVGRKIVPIYNAAYGIALDGSQIEILIDQVSESAYSQRYLDAGYRREFVKQFVKGLSFVHRAKRLPSADELR